MRRVLTRPAPIAPSVIATTGVGIIAVTALVISTWELAHSSEAQPSTVTVLAGGVGGTTAPVTAQASGATPFPSAKPKATLAKLALTAVRGDCWLEVRVSSPTGQTLFADMLEQGRSIRFVQRRLWLAFGAGGNLDVTLNGQRVVSFPTGTATAIVTAKGVNGPSGT